MNDKYNVVEEEYPDYKLDYFGDEEVKKFFSNKIPFAVRLIKEGKWDTAIFKYKGGITFRVNLGIYGYRCLERVNGYTLFYDEREEFCKSHNIPAEELDKSTFIIIEYGPVYTPIISIYDLEYPEGCRKFAFNRVDDFEKYYIGLIKWRESLPKKDRKPIYFIDLREKAPFDELNM